MIKTRGRAVRQYDESNNFIAEYRTAAEAARHTGIGRTCIVYNCRGKFNRTKQKEENRWYKWRYKDGRK